VPPAEPLVVHLPAGQEAWPAFQKLAHLPYVLFFDSAAFDSHLGRYSFITADPIQVEKASGPEEIRSAFTRLEQDFIRWRVPYIEKLPPFQGGLAGLWGYGVSRAFERLPAPRITDFDVPDLVLGWYDWVLAFDHWRKESWLISTGIAAQASGDRLDRAESRADAILSLLDKEVSPVKQLPSCTDFLPDQLAPSLPVLDEPPITSNFASDEFRQVIRKGIEYTHAGDCFQVNLAQRLLAPFQSDPIALYERLRKRNPANFGAYFDLGSYVVASASPERFIRVAANGKLETRPIKGTRPRGATIEEDASLARELQASTKDHAENIMIVDLMRNDLGRVAQYGTVQVPQLCGLESNVAVHHLVSVVEGKLQRGKSPFDVLRATFPGGSVTGAPKVRAMEIIAELEPTTRGAYCGCLGYISFSGAMDTNILIRTFTLGRGWAQFPVGGGIVADSDPDLEYAETLHKAKGLLAALK
jgi:para-aminobenzoate synthetase component 1